KLDAEEYGRVLKQLEEAREDILAYHVAHWRLLVMTGHKEQAVHLAQTYPHPPTSPFDVLAIAQVYAELDLREDALQLLKRYATEFGYSANFWNTYAEQ